MSVSGYCAWSFKPTTEDSTYKDPFIARFKLLIDTFGLCLSNGKVVTSKHLQQVAQSETPLTHDLWKTLGYPFLQSDRRALNKLMTGAVVFNKQETECLEALCGDFFCLNGKPRNQHKVPAQELVA